MNEIECTASLLSDNRPVVLLVDDQPDNLLLLGHLLEQDYRVRAAPSGEAALHAVTTPPKPDLVILDVMMPGLDGYETYRELKRMPDMQDIPVIFSTALGETYDEIKALKLGAVDFIPKPLQPSVTLARIQAQITAYHAKIGLLRHQEQLQSNLESKERQYTQVRDMTLLTLASMVEARDTETGHHLLRTQNYVRILCQELLPQDGTRESQTLQSNIIQAASLHDIGKVGIPDDILHNPGKLSPEEYAVIQTHSLIGAKIIERAREESAHIRPDEGEDSNNLLAIALQIVSHHHERWDGTGYPYGLAGTQIPLAGRIMALADVYDALTSRRVYKPSMALEKAAAIIEEGTGTHFDPDVVAAFQRRRSDFETLAIAYRDKDSSL